MSAFFGIQNERVSAGTPYKIHFGYLSMPAKAFSEQWQTEPKVFAEVISSSARLDLTHNGVHVTTLAEYSEQEFLDSIPVDVAHWISQYMINEQSSLSLELTIVLAREFWVLSESASAHTIQKAGTAFTTPFQRLVTYWVDPEDLTQSEKWASAMRQNLDTSGKTHQLAIDRGPGFCVSDADVLASIVAWKSIEQKPYARAICKAQVFDFLKNDPEWKYYTAPTTNELIQQLLAFNANAVRPCPPPQPVNKKQETAGLIDIMDATEPQCFVLAEIVRRGMGPTVSLPTLRLIFKGCLLPFYSFTPAILRDIPDGLLRDIQLWFFLRIVGDEKKSGQPLTTEDAHAIYYAIQRSDWKENLHDPLSLGYLPY